MHASTRFCTGQREKSTRAAQRCSCRSLGESRQSWRARRETTRTRDRDRRRRDVTAATATFARRSLYHALIPRGETRSGLRHIKHTEQNRLGTVLRHLRQPGAPVTVSPPSGTEVRSGPGGTGGVGRGRRLQCRRPRPGAGDVRINPGLAFPTQWQWWVASKRCPARRWYFD
jgi:hypothetical protein